MNRNEEYQALLAELDAINAPAGAIARAMRRDKRRRQIVRPLSTLAAVFALFVILVNCSTTVAYACSRVPGLRELAEAVTFSRSLSDAVDNEYVQPVELEQAENGVTARVEYLIVDQKSVTVFYRFLSDRYPHLQADMRVFQADGTAPAPCSYGPNDLNMNPSNGELRSMTMDFFRDDVPPALLLRFMLWDMSETMRPPEAGIWDDSPERNIDYVAEFDFLLEFDPYFTAQGRHFTPNQTIVLDAQTLRVTNVDVYPSYLSLTVEGDAANTATLEHLDFYLITDKGERFDPVSSGVVSVHTWGPDGTTKSISLRADSTFFYDASSVTLYCIGAEFLDKDKQTIHVDLKNQTPDFMPEGTEFVSAQREGSRWVITVLQKQGASQTFMEDYYDAEGNEYTSWSWTTGATMPDSDERAPEGYVFESFPLNNYPYDEVWLTPRYTGYWTAETPVAVTIDLR